MDLAWNLFHFILKLLSSLIWNLLTTSYLFARYGAMIMEALSELNDPNGSDIAAIFRFIEVGYLHLLFSFDFTVLQQLFNVKLWSSFKFWLLLTIYLHLTVLMY